jgi:3-hydroxy-4-methylanthranilate adenylyltransferase
MVSGSWWGAHLLNRGPGEDVWAISRGVVTYAELRQKVADLRNLFRGHGIGRKSTVALRMLPSFTLLQALFALWSCEAQVILLDFRLQPTEYEPLVKLLEPQFVVGCADNRGQVVGFHEEIDLIVRRRPTGQPHDTDCCLVQFSSGSTGEAKVIGRSAGSLLDELDRYATLDRMPCDGDRLILLNSIVHTMGLIGGVLHSLNTRTTLVFPPSLRAADVLHLATETGACAIFGVPIHFDLLNRIKCVPKLPSLRLAVSAGEQLPLGTYEEFQRRYQLHISPIYGMTEVGIIASDLVGISPPPIVGRPINGIDLRVIDQELYIRMDRSPYLATGGSGRFSNGWLRTYDRCEQDARSGVLKILGRADSLVTIGGIKVDLAEVELVLMQHPSVSEVVVTYGGGIEAFVAGDASVNANKLTLWCRNRLSAVKIPKRFFIATELPRNACGKLVRNREVMYTRCAQKLPSAESVTCRSTATKGQV